jgi:hypothetical protein
MRAPVSRSGIESSDSQDKCAGRRREGRNHGNSRTGIRDRRPQTGNILMHRATRAYTRQARRGQSSRQLRSHGTAIGLHGRRRLPLHAATMRALAARSQAETKRRKHQPHKEDGHRRALKGTPQHIVSLPRPPLPSVIHVTGDDESQLKSSPSPVP